MPVVVYNYYDVFGRILFTLNNDFFRVTLPVRGSVIIIIINSEYVYI